MQEKKHKSYLPVRVVREEIEGVCCVLSMRVENGWIEGVRFEGGQGGRLGMIFETWESERAPASPTWIQYTTLARRQSRVLFFLTMNKYTAMYAGRICPNTTLLWFRLPGLAD